MRVYRFLKRIEDLAGATTGCIVLLPVLLGIAVIIKYTSRGPVLYRGVRTGLGNNRFRIYKFRTMVVNAEQQGGHSTALNDPRITRFGRFLRQHKIDELPQIINVIRGEMSLVGPRPQVPFYTDKYRGELLRILKVKPGITDFASFMFIDMDAVLGNEDVDAKYEREIEPEKNRLRLKYVEEQGFWTDTKILLATLLKMMGVRVNWRP